MRLTHLARRALLLATLVASFVACDGATFRCDPSPSWSVRDEPRHDDDAGIGGFCAGECSVNALALGDRHTCVAVGGLNEIVCFGANEEGQSSPTSPSRETPPVALQQRTHVPDSGDDGSIDAGAVSTCALFRGALVCWGSRAMFGDEGASDAPQVIFEEGVTQLHHATAHISITRFPGEQQGSVVEVFGAWDGSFLGADAPLARPVRWGASSHLLATGGFSSWGSVLDDRPGASLLERTGGVPPPGRLAPGPWLDVASVPDPAHGADDACYWCFGAAGPLHACTFAQAAGVLACSGDNRRGQLGHGTMDEGSLAFVPLPAFTEQLSLHRPCIGGHLDVRVQDGAIVVGEPRGGHTCAMSIFDEVWCWGANDRGQLGDGTLSDRATPVRVAELPSVRGLSCGGEHTCAIADDGELWCWGDNSFGQLGVPSSEVPFRAVPQRVDPVPAGMR